MAQNWPADTIQININSGNPNFPFPQFNEYKAGKSLALYNAQGVTHADMEKTMREGYRIMMNRSIYSGDVLNGLKYIMYNNGVVPANYGTFVSEGDGYALLAAAYMADKTTFDGLYCWIHDNRFDNVTRFLDGTTLRGTYNKGKTHTNGWVATATDGNASDWDAATDGDDDVALALLMAYMQWGPLMNVDPAGPATNISYLQEALTFITTMVDTMAAPDGGGPVGYASGDIGVDGYVKSGNTWGEITNWRYGTQTTYPWATITPYFLGAQSKYVDYLAPAYYHEFASFLTAQGSTPWCIGQYQRTEAASDWVMGQLGTSVPQAGTYSISAANAVTFGSFSDGEDFRLPWRTVLNYVWHGNPTTSWYAASHSITATPNQYEQNVATNYAKFLNNPDPCQTLGYDPSVPEYKGIATLNQAYTTTGAPMDNYRTNYSLGTGVPSAVAAADTTLLALLYRQCELKWDDENTALPVTATANQRYINSTPKYFHDWFRMLGMLVASGNAHPPSEMVAGANMKVYMAVNKTFAFPGDLVTYTVSYRNYGSVAASRVKIITPIPSQYQFVSASNGGSLSGGTITWNVGSVPGFNSTTGITPTEGSMTFVVQVAPTATGRVCISSTISASNGTGWTSNEYPNNPTYTMQRNCVDILNTRSLAITKTANATQINPSDTVIYTINFKNTTNAGWLNGGRQGVNASFANGEAGPNSAYWYFRLWNNAQEAYINYQNYRMSYFLNSAANVGLYNATTNPTGWSFTPTITEGFDDGNGTALNTAAVTFSYQSIPYGSDANGKWNQRFIMNFDSLIAAPSSLLYDYTTSTYQIHKGVQRAMKLQIQYQTNPPIPILPAIANDWSYSAALDVGSNDKKRFYVITDNYEDPNLPGQVVTGYESDVCTAPDGSFNRILVEEYDGYTWRRILGNGPMPGREMYNVVVTDTLPKGLSWVGFTEATTLGVTATYNTANRVITWEIPVMLINDSGQIAYKAKALGTCPKADTVVHNYGWIYSSTDSPISSEASVTVTCTALPPLAPPGTSMTKTANKSSYATGDAITYKIKWVNTQGTTVSPLTNAPAYVAPTGWITMANGSIPDLNHGVLYLDPNKNTNRPNANHYSFAYNQSYGANGSVTFTIIPGGSSDMSVVMRYAAGSPITKSVMLHLKFGVSGSNTVEMDVTDNGVARTGVPSYFSTSFGEFGGSNTPVTVTVSLIGGTMQVWINNLTGPPLFTVTGITYTSAGYFGYYNSNPSGSTGDSNNELTALSTSTDAAFNVYMYDPIPSGVTYSIANNAVVNNAATVYTGKDSSNTVRWKTIPGPLMSGDSVVYTWQGTVNCTGLSFITNTAYMSIQGISPNPGAQAVVNCPGVVTPVTYVDFEGSRVGQNNLLNWSTATELQNNYFVVERAPDGLNFSSIGTVKGSGTTASINQYSFTDKNAPAQTLYYRLNQVDYNGNQQYSKVIAINATATGNVTIYPNPTAGQVTVAFSATTASKALITFYSEVGVTVLEQTLIVNEGVNSVGVSISSLPASVYFVKISGVDGLEKVYKLIKE